MSGGGPSKRPIVLYLGGVVAIATATVSMLVLLYRLWVPEFTDKLVQNPVTAAQEFPVAVFLVVAILGSIALLVGLIVGFGVHYGPDDRRRRKKKQ